MEACVEVAPSPIRLWWSKLGKWQALAALLTPGVFFITLGVTGDTNDATALAFAVAFATIAFAFAVAVAAAATTTTAATVAIVVAFTGAAFTTAAVANEIPGVSKKAVWLSYAGEFLLILLPMAWVLHG